MPPREENIDSLGTAVHHNFRRTLLVPSREIISSLDAAVQHDFRRTLLLPSREAQYQVWALRYSITSARYYCHLGRRISVAWALQYSITSSARC